MRVVHCLISSILVLLCAAAFFGCEGRHIDMSRRGQPPPDPYKPEPPPSEEKIIDVSIKRVSPGGADPKTDPAVFNLVVRLSSDYFGFPIDFYVDNSGKIRWVENDNEHGSASCLKAGAGGACEQFQFNFDFSQPEYSGTVFSRTVPFRATWRLGDKYRLQGSFDEQAPSMAWGEGRIEEVTANAGSSSSHGRWLKIFPPAAPPPDSPVRLSDPQFVYAARTSLEGQYLQYELNVPVPRTDTNAHTVLWQGTDSGFSIDNFFVNQPASASFRGFYRKFGDADKTTGTINFTIEKVTAGLRK